MARILVVEDDDLSREIVRELLEYAGHDVMEAPDGVVALRLLSYDEKRYDLVVTDLIMPKKDGMELITEIKRDYPRIKIIAVTGGDENFPALSYLRTSKSMRADYVLSKPFRNKELLKAVDEVLQLNRGV